MLKLFTFAIAGSAASAAGAPFIPDRYLISAFVDPMVNSSLYPIEYARFAAANFNTLLGGFGATTPALVAAQLDACAATGLACIPTTCESPAGPGPEGSCVALPGAPAAWGFNMRDEPAVADFAALANWSASIAARAPGAMRFINLLPNYATPAQLGAPTYAAYIEQYIAAVAPNMLCFDHYPQFGEQPFDPAAAANTTQAGYLRNLADFRAASLASGLPFYNYFNIMPYNDLADISLSQVRWQAFASLAHGSSGVLYFCYWNPLPAQWHGAMVSAVAPWTPGGGDGAVVFQPTPHYAQAQAVNAKLRVLGGALLLAASTGVASVRAPGSAAFAAVPPNPDVAALSGSGEGGADLAVLVGLFSRGDGSRGVLLVNHDTTAPRLITVNFTAGVSAVAEIDEASPAPRAVLDDAPELPGLQLRLLEGDARLLIFNAKGR